MLKTISDTLRNRNFLVLLFFSFVGCAGMDRGCASCSAESFGADWVIVQYRNDGKPIACWKLRGSSVSNETHSDGIYWKDQANHLVHISGWYNRVQVANGDYASAAASVGVNADDCTSGVYAPKQPSGVDWFNKVAPGGEPSKPGFNRIQQ
jgi:hypothetical protein